MFFEAKVILPTFVGVNLEMCNSHTTQNMVEVITNVLVKHNMNMELF